MGVLNAMGMSMVSLGEAATLEDVVFLFLNTKSKRPGVHVQNTVEIWNIGVSL